jgi:hypothetical protein
MDFANPGHALPEVIVRIFTVEAQKGRLFESVEVYGGASAAVGLLVR